jgi:hypothetical protein
VPVSFSYNNSNETLSTAATTSRSAGTLTFAPGQTVLTLDIPAHRQHLGRGDGNVHAQLFIPVNSTIATPFAQADRLDNDQPSGTPVVRVADQTVDEAAGKVSSSSRWTSRAPASSAVNYATSTAPALAGSDFTAVATPTLTFAPGEVSKVVTVNLLNDSLAEGREYFDLKLSSPVGATLLPHPTGRASIGATTPRRRRCR